MITQFKPRNAKAMDASGRIGIVTIIWLVPPS